MNNASRKEILLTFGATESEAAELIQYNENVFDVEKLRATEQQTVDDEPFVSVWQEYEAEAKSKQDNIFQILKNYIVQLNFPIIDGISGTDSYKAATLRGKQVVEIPEATGLLLEFPEQLQLTLYQTVAGKIPILFTSHREDFIALVQALSKKNEPAIVPDSMGACMVKGLNNWDRIRRSGMPISQLAPHKSRYQDTVIILSDGPYSGVSAEAMGLTEGEWKILSLMIRREHECTHYVTQRLFGSARNRLLDELIADYAGITEAIGTYKADWFLKFIGLENYPEYRIGARLENYRGNPPMSEESFVILQKIAYNAAQRLEKLDVAWNAISKEQRVKKEERIRKLCTMDLEELATS